MCVGVGDLIVRGSWDAVWGILEDIRRCVDGLPAKPQPLSSTQVCIYVCMYICMYVYICTSIFLYFYLCLFICMYVYMDIISIYIKKLMGSFISIYLHNLGASRDPIFRTYTRVRPDGTRYGRIRPFRVCISVCICINMEVYVSI
jgi:hypothetical protein